jgi:osmotically inducible protein OsmC
LTDVEKPCIRKWLVPARICVTIQHAYTRGAESGSIFKLTRSSDMKIKRKGSAAWQGGMKDGSGNISTESGALKEYPYGFSSRFEGIKGSNPEELIGAAHASCFTMALSKILGEAGLTAEKMETTAEVTLEQLESGFAITTIHLMLEANIPGADQAKFEELAGKAKAGCPVSKLLKAAEITLEAKLI